jgi:1-acyl-sn-glycerol-3-phosphate acyltransferase
MALERPTDYVAPPPPSPTDVARTTLAATAFIARTLARVSVRSVAPLPSTSTADGLASVGASFARALEWFGVELEVLGRERVPREGGLVFMWNQESHLDHFVLAAAMPRPFLSLYNNAVARFPFYGAHMKRSGHFHVDRNDEAQWREAVARAADEVKRGACVLVSPEGTRSWDTRLLPMKRGAFLLATRSERPIVCATVIGGHARLPRGSAFVRRGKVRVVFSDAISNSGDTSRLQEEVIATFTRTKNDYAL